MSDVLDVQPTSVSRRPAQAWAAWRRRPRRGGGAEGQLERTVTAAGDASNDGGVADVAGGAEVGNEIAGKEGVPSNRSGGVLHVVVEAGGGRGNDHGRNGALCPPRVEQGLEVEHGIARAAGGRHRLSSLGMIVRGRLNSALSPESIEEVVGCMGISHQLSVSKHYGVRKDLSGYAHQMSANRRVSSK